MNIKILKKKFTISGAQLVVVIILFILFSSIYFYFYYKNTRKYELCVKEESCGQSISNNTQEDTKNASTSANSNEDSCGQKIDVLNKKISKISDQIGLLHSWYKKEMSSETTVVNEKEVSYKNNLYDFSFIIPDNYQIVESKLIPADGLILRINKKIDNTVSMEGYISLRFYKSGYDSLKSITQEFLEEDLIIEKTDIEIDGTAGNKYYIGGIASGYQVFSYKDGKALYLNIYPDDPNNTIVMDKIVQTFKFSAK